MNCVPKELLEDLAGRMPDAPAPEVSSRNGASFDLDQWIRDRGLDVSGPTDWKNGRRWIFRACPWNSNHDNGSAYILQFPNGAIAAGCLHNGCRGKNWHQLRDLFEPGSQSKSQRSGTLSVPPTGWEHRRFRFSNLTYRHFPQRHSPTGSVICWGACGHHADRLSDLAAMLALAMRSNGLCQEGGGPIKPEAFEPVNIFSSYRAPTSRQNERAQ